MTLIYLFVFETAAKYWLRLQHTYLQPVKL